MKLGPQLAALSHVYVHPFNLLMHLLLLAPVKVSIQLRQQCVKAVAFTWCHVWWKKIAVRQQLGNPFHHGSANVRSLEPSH